MKTVSLVRVSVVTFIKTVDDQVKKMRNWKAYLSKRKIHKLENAQPLLSVIENFVIKKVYDL